MLGGNTAARFLLLFLEEHTICLCLIESSLLCCFEGNKQAEKKQQRLETGHTVSNIYIFRIYFPFTA